MRQTTHSIDANGLTHFVRDAGDLDAPPALLLHGFPDDSSLWDPVTPALTGAGFRVIAPDMRGFGKTGMAARIADYEINVGAIPDMLAIMDALAITRCHVVGHDFGAPVAWGLAAQHPSRTLSLTAISVGHARAFLRAGADQKRMSWYILMHQARGLCEYLYRRKDWRLLRRVWNGSGAGAGAVDAVIARLAPDGRLTAALNWYRANISVTRMLRPPPMGYAGEEIVRVPTLGVLGLDDPYLGEPQMRLSRDYVEGAWSLHCLEGVGHWVPVEAPAVLSALLIDHWRGVR